MQRCQTTDAHLVVKLRTISQATFNDPTVVHRSPSGGRFENAVVFRCMNMRREGAIMVEVRMMQTPCSQRRQWQTCRHSFNLVDRIDRRISVEHLTAHRRLLKGSPLPSSPLTCYLLTTAVSGCAVVLPRTRCDTTLAFNRDLKSRLGRNTNPV